MAAESAVLARRMQQRRGMSTASKRVAPASVRTSHEAGELVCAPSVPARLVLSGGAPEALGHGVEGGVASEGRAKEVRPAGDDGSGAGGHACACGSGA